MSARVKIASNLPTWQRMVDVLLVFVTNIDALGQMVYAIWNNAKIFIISIPVAFVFKTPVLVIKSSVLAENA